MRKYLLKRLLKLNSFGGLKQKISNFVVKINFMSKELKTGIIAIIITAIFIWGYSFLKGQNLFDTNTRYFNVEYSNIAGLTKSSFVTINGLKVGKIVKISFNKNPDKRGELIVRFSVEKDFIFSKNILLFDMEVST